LSSPNPETRTIALPGRGLVVAVEQSTPGRAFEFIGASGEQTRFGDSLKVRAQVGAGYVPHWLAAVSKDRFFAMPLYNEALIDEWETSGRFLRRYRLPAPWFIPYGLGPLKELQQSGIRGTRIAMSGGVWRDATGRLWTITNVPDPKWRSRSDSGIRDEHGNRYVQLWGFDRREVLDAIVAVYALTDTSVVLVASGRFAMPLSRFLSDSVVVERRYVDREVISFNLFRFRLVGDTTHRGVRK
jgi:hypothetical protein